LLSFNASAILPAPSSPILLSDKLIGMNTNPIQIKLNQKNKTTQNNTYSSEVKVLLYFKAPATLTAPSAPI
jgi:hypothetical protein